MKFQSHGGIGLSAFFVSSLFLGCGVKPAPTEEQTAALLRGGAPPLVRVCERLLRDCDRLHRPGRFRDVCVQEVLRGPCGHPPRADAGREDTGNHGRDAAVDVGAGRRDASVDVAAGHQDAAADRVDGHVDTGAPDLRSVTVDGSTNHCPVITTFNVPTSTVLVGASITITVEASAPDPGDTLSYSWDPIIDTVASLDPVRSSTTGTTVLTCIAAGSVSLELGVVDGTQADGSSGCGAFETAVINCVCPDGGCEPPACLPDQASCGSVAGPPCCNGEPCTLFVCGGCVGSGDSCSDSVPCCSGVACTSGICGGCLPDGSACSTATPCCSGACGDNGVCGGPACIGLFSPCDGTVPCCADLAVVCTRGFCAPPNPPCVPNGQLCTPPQTCCTGDICLGVCGMLEGDP
jgi:hypothetical protein